MYDTLAELFANEKANITLISGTHITTKTRRAIGMSFIPQNSWVHIAASSSESGGKVYVNGDGITNYCYIIMITFFEHPRCYSFL